MPHVRDKASSPIASASIAFVLPVICYLYILLFAAKGQPKQRVALRGFTD
jgi:fucose permease